MPIRQDIKTFWWFQQDRIGGMGKPGFNRTHWMDFSMEEAALFNWIGQHLYYRPSLPLTALWDYLEQFGAKVAKFYDTTPEAVLARFAGLRDHSVLLKTIDEMNERAQVFEGQIRVEETPKGPTLSARFGQARVAEELDALQTHGISALISLMEDPPSTLVTESKLATSGDLDIHHFPVPDLTPPGIEQVQAFAKRLFGYTDAGKSVAIHCFAGVGRTTTMLVAAHLLTGHNFGVLKEQIQTNNPHYQPKGSQWHYLCALHDEIQSGAQPLLS